MSYCTFCESLETSNIHRIYHDTEYGKKVTNDRELFERFCLEIFQAGLSWDIILKKRTFLRDAFSCFDIQIVANYSEIEIQKLLANSKIVRHRIKIKSIIFNAQKILQIQQEFGSFYNWLILEERKTIEDWTKLLKKNFKFVGIEIAAEFLKGSGLLPGAHDQNCYLKHTK